MRKDTAAPNYFVTPADFRRWLLAHHRTATELWVGYYRKASGRPSMTWPESVDEALCFGWIDGIRKKVNGESYMIRFTPRRPQSIWSAVNIARVDVLTREKRIQPAGVAAFARRDEKKSGIYAFENRARAKLIASDEQQFRRVPAAWKFFEAQPPGYRRRVAWWVISAKRADTRRRRLQTLIGESAAQRRL